MFYSKKQENVNIALGLAREARNIEDMNNSYLAGKLEHLVLLMESEIENPYLLSTEGENFVHKIATKLSKDNDIFTLNGFIDFVDRNFGSTIHNTYLERNVGNNNNFSFTYPNSCQDLIALAEEYIRVLINEMGAEEFCGQLEKNFNLKKGCILSEGMNISADENVKNEDAKTNMKTITITLVVKDLNASEKLIAEIEEFAYNNDKNFIRVKCEDASDKEIRQYKELQD